MERTQHRRKIHDRSSERRRTCLPVLTPSASADDLDLKDGNQEVVVFKIEDTDVDDSQTSESQGARSSEGHVSDEEEDPDSDTCMYKIGEDDVEMEKDKVKRTTQGQPQEEGSNTIYVHYQNYLTNPLYTSSANWSYV